MGAIEVKAKAIRRRGDIQRAVLATLAVGGIVALGAIAGNAVQLLKYLPGHKNRFAYYTKTVAGRLVQRGEAEWVRQGGRVFLRITEKGTKALAFAKEKVALQTSRKRWDRRWRMVAFDIPERRAKVRARLRAVMHEVGFVRMQNSLWVFPHDCEEFVALLKAELKIGKDVLYAVIEQIEHDSALRKHFGLPPE